MRKNYFTLKELQNALVCVCNEIIKNEPYLTEIDTVIGDGDHGIGMKRGFKALKTLLCNECFESINDLLKHSGIELIKTMGGASGVIFGTMFIGGLSELKEDKKISLKVLAKYFDEGAKSISKRGRTKAGDKTMLDALLEVVKALQKAALQESDIAAALKDAYLGAIAGVENTKAMQSKIGRSKNFREKTVNLPDPGAVSVSLIFKALHEYTQIEFPF